MSANSIYPRLFAKLFASPLLLHPPVRSTFERELLRRMFGDAVALPPSLLDAEGPRMEAGTQPRPGTLGQPSQGEEEFKANVLNYRKAMLEVNRTWRVEKLYRKIGKVAIVTLEGVIDKRISDFDLACFGGCDLTDVDLALQDAAADPAVEIVLIYINTPGGSVVGTVETAARVAALREHKEVHVFIEVLCCSAGYYIASQADWIAAAPSSIVGSIGVYMAVLDATRWYEMEGYRVQMMKSGRYKAMGAPWNPLSDEEKEMLQDQCDATYESFKAAVNSQRPRVADSTMQGQWFDGTQADELYLVDELTGDNLDEYVSRLLTKRR